MKAHATKNGKAVENHTYKRSIKEEIKSSNDTAAKAGEEAKVSEEVKAKSAAAEKVADE